MKWFLLLPLLFIDTALAQSFFDDEPAMNTSSTLDSCRDRNSANFACGECETPLQDDFTDLLSQITGQPAGDRWSDGFNNESPMRTQFPDGSPVNLENTLSRIKDMMKSNNPEGGNGLNYMVIGQSESLQDTTMRDGKMYPRIAIKSPNSELWVTFNTDPTSAAYQTLEVMRWNGKDAKYDFIELDFGQNNPENPAANRPAKFDGTGQKCVACHKEPDSRPNWETYRAWSGIVPSRDDMIEQDARHGHPVTEGEAPIGMDGRAYVSFLEQVVDTKEGRNITPGADRRLGLLDIPIDDRIQFAGRTPPVSSLPPRAQLDAIRTQVSQNDGFYRIPHFPYKGTGGGGSGIANFDLKTADYAGPSQLAFDQLSGQNFCRISQRLIEDDDYDNFKWVVAGIAQCNAASNLEDWVPESYRAEIGRYFSANPNVLFNDLASGGQLPPAAQTANMDFAQVTDLLARDTQRNFERADGFKRDRHQTMGVEFLTQVETDRQREPGAAQTEAEYFSSQFTAPVRYYPQFHAIGDAGGVNGVENASAEEIVGLRAVLEPLGVDPGQWSMMRGPNSERDYDSLAFSDQFPLLFGQRAILRAYNEDILRDPAAQDPAAQGPYGLNRCEALRIASNRTLSTIRVTPQPQANQVDITLAAACRGLDGLPDVVALTQSIEAARTPMIPRAQELFGRCVRCHGGSDPSATPFVGMEGMTTTTNQNPTTPPAAGTSVETVTPWTEDAWQRFNVFLASGMSETAGTSMGEEIVRRLNNQSMPSGGWRVHGESQADKLANDTARRAELATYVSLTAALAENGDIARRALCERFNNAARGTTGEQPDAATTPERGAIQQ